MSKLDVFSSFQGVGLNLVKNDEKETIEVSGIASSEHVDNSGEIILQDGLDWSYCLKSGALNYDHRNEPSHILGAPKSITRTMHNGKKATALKGVLYAKKGMVKDLVENYNAMKSAGGIRKIGFSIEGQVLERDKKNPNIITRARVLNVSLTHNPCNSEATVELVKNILNSIDGDTMTEEVLEKNEYADLHMSLSEARLSCEYAEKLVALLEGLPEDADLPEWVQRKIAEAQDNLQKSYHYLDQEMKEEMIEPEMDKDVNPGYLDAIDAEAVVAPEPVKVEFPEAIEKGYKSKDELDKMDQKQLIEYIRFLEGLQKESDLSPIQPQSLEDGEIASNDLNIGMPDELEDEEDEEEEGPEVEIEGLTPAQIKELVLGLLKLNLPINKVVEYLERYTK